MTQLVRGLGLWIGGGAFALVGLVAVDTHENAVAPAWSVTPVPDWTQQAPGAAPPPIQGPVATYDDATGQLVVWAQQLVAPNCTSTAQMWIWDGATWSRQSVDPGNAPTSLTAPSMVYDAATRQLLLFGVATVGCPLAGAVEQTWSWNGTRWTELDPAASPPAGYGGCAGFDASTGQVVMFGDLTDSDHGVDDPNTWTWDGTTWTPHLLTPAPPLSTFACSLAYDARNRELVLVSDNRVGANPTIDTWDWNGAAWSEHSPSGPIQVSGVPPTMAYDATTGEVTLYNALDPCVPRQFGDCLQNVSETWVWTGSVWQRAAPASVPTSIVDGVFAFDGGTRQLVLSGLRQTGGIGSASETWIYRVHAGSPATPTRLAGSDRVSTAVAVSQNEFPALQSASAVVLARADQYADALTGGPLAVAKKASLLLTSSGSLDADTRTEITRVLPPGGTVYLLGGTSALSAAIEHQVVALGFTAARIAGSDRYSTAVAVAGALGNPTTVLEASGTNFADALSAGPAAASAHAAILLTAGGLQSAATSSYLAAHPGVRFAIGGPAASADPAATALVGSDRYATGAQVARAFFPAATSFGVATGTGFADALSGGAFSAARDQPILLTPSTDALPEPVAAFVSTHAGLTTAVQIFGGAAAISDSVVTSVSRTLADG